MQNNELKFSQKLFASTRRSVLDAETLPPWTYTSQEFFELEAQRIFRKVWVCIGRVERVSAPSNYFTMDLLGTPLVVVRGDDNIVRAFANSCRHRGTIVAEGEGHCKALRCPYHSWTYDLRGRLISAPTDMDRTSNFSLRNYGLVPIRMETWAGFLFVNFDNEAESLETYLGDLPELVAPYNLDDMVCVRRRFYDVACNWKVYLDNTKDQLHVTTVHRASLNRVAPPRSFNRNVQETRGNYVSSFLQIQRSMGLLEKGEGFPKIRSLVGEMAERTTTPLILPSVYIGCTVDCAYYLRIQPVAVDRVILEQGGLFCREVTTLPDFEERAQPYFQRWDTTAREDNDVCERQQRGLSSPLCVPGRFSHREDNLHRISKWIVDRVVEA
jgi:choline monooxygenase